MSERGAARPESARPAYLGSYVPDARRYDELLDSEGNVRAHWQTLMSRLTRDNPREEARRSLELTRRLIIENGVTYNIYADPQGADRPWALDPVPLVLSAEEWSSIEQGVAQRVQLLDTLLADLYGPQRLLAEGLVPPALAFGHPNFLWPCHGIVPRDGQWLHMYAADLARAPDGRWWLLADRTQGPSGAGYALENREIVEQVLPDALRELHVRGLREFFEEFRERMLSFADSTERPLAVILTPGPFNETYFEHAYLARQLGFVLAEGHDLTVRDDTVYLKTLAGLKRVHTIYRRLDDDYCDPVELRSDSALGVPGLLGAVRAGRVVLANALGSGVLESAAWHGFLPGVAERLLGAPLSLPSVATWWCGERPALEYVLANLDRLVLKPTYPNQRFEPVFGYMLKGAAREEVIARIRARPYAYVAQEHIALSQVPVLRAGGAHGFRAKVFSLRVYAISTPTGRIVMPGGLARIATETAADVVSTQRGGGSKDIWILSAQTAPDRIDAPSSTRRETTRHNDVSSRLVENLYWFGRYAVRCEDKARLMRATLLTRSDEALWRNTVRICRELGFIAADVDPTISLRDERNPYGIIADVRRLGWCASQVRSRLSNSHWRAIMDLQRQLQDSIAEREDPIKALDRLLLSLAAVAGFAFDHMTRDEGWRLLRIGRRLERLQMLAALLARHLHSEAATRATQVEWVLKACDSSRVYRSRYVVAPRVGPMLDLLLRDAEHPRALEFQWQALANDIATLTAALGNSSELRLDASIPVLGDQDLASLERNDADGVEARRALAERVHALSGAAGDLSDRLSMRYFSHTGLDSHALAT